MYSQHVGLGAVAPVSDWGNQTVWTGTIEGSPDWLRFSTVGLNCGLRFSDPAMAADLAAAMGHCVRIEGPYNVNGGYITVNGWAILPSGTEFTQGGITYTCEGFQVAVNDVPENPTPPVTSGGTVTTTQPLPPGTDPGSVPADAPQTPTAGGASGGGYGGGGGAGTLTASLPLILAGGLILAMVGGRKRR